MNRSILGDNPNLTSDGAYRQDIARMVPVVPVLTAATTQTKDKNDTITPNKPKVKLLCPLVLRFSQADRNLLDELVSDYGESIVSIIGKSIRLYRGIVDAAEQGGKLIMIKPCRSLTTSHSIDTIDTADNIDNDGSYETVIAVREQFAEKNKTPIALNRAYINASSKLKTQRLATRVPPAVIDNLEELELKTGLSKSAILRDCINLYNFIKRESMVPNTYFYIGELLIDGI